MNKSGECLKASCPNREQRIISIWLIWGFRTGARIVGNREKHAAVYSVRIAAITLQGWTGWESIVPFVIAI